MRAGLTESKEMSRGRTGERIRRCIEAAPTVFPKFKTFGVHGGRRSQVTWAGDPEDAAVTNEEQAALDQAWSRKVAGIAIATLVVAKPQLVSLTPEQMTRCTEIVAEEIFVRLVIGDRTPA
jgi:hypothetical protein